MREKIADMWQKRQDRKDAEKVRRAQFKAEHPRASWFATAWRFNKKAIFGLVVVAFGISGWQLLSGQDDNSEKVNDEPTPPTIADDDTQKTVEEMDRIEFEYGPFVSPPSDLEGGEVVVQRFAVEHSREWVENPFAAFPFETQAPQKEPVPGSLKGLSDSRVGMVFHVTERNFVPPGDVTNTEDFGGLPLGSLYFKGQSMASYGTESFLLDDMIVDNSIWLQAKEGTLGYKKDIVIIRPSENVVIPEAGDDIIVFGQVDSHGRLSIDSELIGIANGQSSVVFSSDAPLVLQNLGERHGAYDIINIMQDFVHCAERSPSEKTCGLEL